MKLPILTTVLIMSAVLVACNKDTVEDISVKSVITNTSNTPKVVSVVEGFEEQYATVGHCIEGIYNIVNREAPEYIRDTFSTEPAFNNTHGEEYSSVNILGNLGLLLNFGEMSEYNPDILVTPASLSKTINDIYSMCNLQTPAALTRVELEGIGHIPEEYQYGLKLAKYYNAFVNTDISDGSNYQENITQGIALAALNTFSQMTLLSNPNITFSSDYQSNETENMINIYDTSLIEKSQSYKDLVKELLIEREYTDTLLESNLAVYPQPSSCDEMQANINKLVPIDPFNQNLSYPHYINADDALISINSCREYYDDDELDVNNTTTIITSYNKDNSIIEEYEVVNSNQKDYDFVVTTVDVPGIINKSYDSNNNIVLKNKNFKSIGLTTGYTYKDTVFIVSGNQIVGKGVLNTDDSYTIPDDIDITLQVVGDNGKFVSVYGDTESNYKTASITIKKEIFNSADYIAFPATQGLINYDYDEGYNVLILMPIPNYLRN